MTDRTKAGGSGILLAVIFSVVLVAAGVSKLFPPSAAQERAAAEKSAAQIAGQRAEQERNRQMGNHCAALGGEVFAFSRRVKETMRDPSSFQHVSTRLGPNESGAHALAMTYRGTNGFGAIDTAVALGEVRNSDCAVRLIAAR